MNNYSKAYKELDEIFKYLPEEEFNKIPAELINKIKREKDDQYKYEVTHIEDFRNQEMLKESRAILAVLYRDYWASDEERKEILEQERKEFLEKEEKKKENQNFNSMFNNRNVIEQDVSQAVVQYKESLFKKIINKIAKWFGRKNRYL